MKPGGILSGRLGSLKKAVERRRLDAFLVTNEANVAYLTGFAGHDSLLLVTPGKQFFITDSRYMEEASEKTAGFTMRLVKDSTYATLKSLASQERLRRIGFEPMSLPYEVAHRLKHYIAPQRLIPARDMVEELRSVKDRAETALIKKSVGLIKRAFAKVSAAVRPGVSERSLARLFELEFINSGAAAAFEPIVACGKNSSRPHAHAGENRIENNSFVKIDAGCKLEGYNSDLTRMVIVGRAPEKFKKIYAIVRAAQELAISMIRPGGRISDIDKAARRIIGTEGFGANFSHALGHGVGLEVHEAPSISSRNDELLKPGMVFTVEPAIYIPGFGGVRIEDMVLVTDKGCEVLTM